MDSPSETTEQAREMGEPDLEADRGADTPEPFAGSLVRSSWLSQPAPTMTLPRATDGDELGSRLAKTNAVARQHSLDRLDTWFPGYDFDAAAQTSDDRRFTVLSLGEVLVEHLKATDAIDRFVNHHDLLPGRLMFSHGEPERRGSRPASVDRSRPGTNVAERVAVGPTIAALRDRWTMIINGVDRLDPILDDVCEQLERVYGCRVNTNVYISWGESMGFGSHWDMHDTIIVPASGTKRWRVFEPLVLSPLRPWIGPEVSERAVWEGEISVGDALVIPRGWGHEVCGSDDLAMHYTIGLTRFTANTLFQRLEHEAGQWPIARADVPYDPREPVISYDRSLHDKPESLAQFAAQLATPEAVDRAVATFRARLELRGPSSLPASWKALATDDWTGLGVRLPVPAGIMPVPGNPGSNLFAFGDHLVDIATPALDAFLALGDTRVWAIDDLPTVDAPGGARALAVELVEAGLGRVAELDS